MRVAIVGSDPQARLALVTALDAAPSAWSLSLHREPPADADVIVCDPGAGIPGAVVFDGDPAGLVARVAESARCAATIVVTSPSGGTGVTAVALHLSAELVARGLDTCLIDLDPVWGVRPRLGLDVVEGPLSVPVPVAAGFRLLAGAGSIERAGAMFDRVVVDAPPGTLDDEPSTNAERLLVTVPTPEGARRARRILDVDPSRGWRVITNRLGPGGEMTHAQFERELGTAVFELPCCPALRDSEDDARLLTRGWTRWSRRIVKLTSAIEGD